MNLSGLTFSFMFSIGYLVTFFTAYYNGLTIGQYWTVFNIGLFGEYHIEAVAFSLIFVLMLYSLYSHINQFSTKYTIKKDHNLGLMMLWVTVMIILTIGVVLIVLSFLNQK